MKFLAVAALGAMFAACAHAQDGGDALAAQLAQVRQQGCVGHVGTAAPLQWSPELARAAQRVDRGEAPLAAAGNEGYRAARVFRAKLTGYPTSGDVADALAERYCATLTDPALGDVAVYRRGTSWVVLLAGRLQVTALADPRAALAKVLALVNDARAKPRRCGGRSFDAAPPVRWNDQLEHAAAQHAQDMAAHDYVEHKGLDGSTPAQRITRSGYAWRSVGENIAAGQATPDDVVRDWLASPGHCANLMNGSYADMGVAFTVNMNAKAAVYWAQEFGRPR